MAFKWIFMKTVFFIFFLSIFYSQAEHHCEASNCALCHGQNIDQKKQTVFESKDGTIRIEQASFHILKGAKNGAAYCVIEAKENDELIGIHYPGNDIKTIELHTHLIDHSGTARMRPVSAFKIEKNQPYTLKTGADHIMLMNIKDGAFDKKESLQLILIFKSGRKVPVQFNKKITTHSCCHND
ncbi:MAG: hypothetical protein CNLJKLNK_01047 [Holosporales bacterium]